MRAVLGHITCDSCRNDSTLHDSRKLVPKECAKWVAKECVPAHEYQCGQMLCPENDIDCIELLNNNQSNERCRIKVRNNLFCFTPIISQTRF